MAKDFRLGGTVYSDRDWLKILVKNQLAGLRNPSAHVQRHHWVPQLSFRFTALSVCLTPYSSTVRMWLLWAGGCDVVVSGGSTSKRTKKWFNPFASVVSPITAEMLLDL